jgi:protein ImuA
MDPIAHSPLDRQALRAALAAMPRRAGPTPTPAPTRIALAGPLDAALPGGGLARAALHEVSAADIAAGAAFCAVLLGRLAAPCLWIAPEPTGWPSAPGRFGLRPERLVQLRAGGADALWAMEEALRCPALGGALLLAGEAPTGDAARRLSLAAGTGGALALVLRPEAPPAATALTSWCVAPMPGGAALGDPCWKVALVPLRGGPGRRWAVTWRASHDRLDAEPLQPEASAPRRARRR